MFPLTVLVEATFDWLSCPGEWYCSQPKLKLVHPEKGGTMENQNKLAGIVSSHHQMILKEWIDSQMSATTLRLDLMKESELRDQSKELRYSLERLATQCRRMSK